MNDALAHERLSEVLELLDRYGDVHDRRWGHNGNVANRALDSQLKELTDQVRARIRFARDVIAAMGESELAAPPRFARGRPLLWPWVMATTRVGASSKRLCPLTSQRWT